MLVSKEGRGYKTPPCNQAGKSAGSQPLMWGLRDGRHKPSEELPPRTRATLPLAPGPFEVSSQQCRELAARYRPVENVALHLVTGVIAQESFLVRALDAFGDDRQVQALAHGDDRLSDGLVLAVLDEVANEGAVHLQGVDREALDLCERGVADSEVVDGDPHTQLLNGGKQLDRPLRILHHQALRQLDLEQLWRHAGFLERRFDIR